MGLDGSDIAVMARVTRYASHTRAGVRRRRPRSLAALGVFASIEQAARCSERPLRGLHVAVQGLGEVGGRLAATARGGGGAAHRLRRRAGARGRGRARAGRDRGRRRSPSTTWRRTCSRPTPRAGSSTPPPSRGCAAARWWAPPTSSSRTTAAGEALHARGILYGPDYVVNAGGLLSVLLETGALDEAAVIARVRAIGDTVAEVWDRRAARRTRRRTASRTPSWRSGWPRARAAREET